MLVNSPFLGAQVRLDTPLPSAGLFIDIDLIIYLMIHTFMLNIKIMISSLTNDKENVRYEKKSENSIRKKQNS